MDSDSAALEGIIGYRFRDRDLLHQALTHRSRAQEDAQPPLHNERFEFLGDAVLGFLVSESLVRQLPDASEGQLTQLKAYLVSGAHLLRVSRRLGLGDFLRLGRGEDLTGGRGKKALLVDAVEALLAAIYLDGGIEPSRRFCEEHILTAAALEAAAGHTERGNFKSALQELLQRERLPSASYHMVREIGPDHKRRFIIELRVGSLFSSRAESTTKKSAEQEAARLALDHFQASPQAAAEDEIVETPERDGP